MPGSGHGLYSSKLGWKILFGDGSLSNQDAVPGEVLQASGFGLVLFGIFLNCLDYGKKNT